MQQPPSHVALPEKRPVGLLILAIALIGLGILLTPSVLIALGPMRGSLTHSNDLVRRSTLLEVNVLRALCWSAALVLMIVALRWRAFRSSRLVAGVLEHPIDESSSRPAPLLGFSFWVMLAAQAAWLAYVKFGARVLSPRAIQAINREDGVIEGGSALLFLLASIGSAVLAWKARTRPRRVFAGILAVGFFFCTGEEMSWGQHLFGWKAPEAITKVNVQGETNLHNLSGYFADHAFIAGVFLYGGVLPFVAAASPVWRRVFDRFGLIVPSLGLAVGFILVTLNQPYLIGRLVGATGNRVRIQEGRELLSALGFGLTVLEALLAQRRVAAANSDVAATSASPTRLAAAGQ
jgi:hypothetical protein